MEKSSIKTSRLCQSGKPAGTIYSSSSWASHCDCVQTCFLISSTVPKWVHHAIKPVVLALEKYIPQPYAGEIRGLAPHFGDSLSDVIILNFAYEISAYVSPLILPGCAVKTYNCNNLYGFLDSARASLLRTKMAPCITAGTWIIPIPYWGIWLSTQFSLRMERYNACSCQKKSCCAEARIK